MKNWNLILISSQQNAVYAVTAAVVKNKFRIPRHNSWNLIWTRAPSSNRSEQIVGDSIEIYSKYTDTRSEKVMSAKVKHCSTILTHTHTIGSKINNNCFTCSSKLPAKAHTYWIEIIEFNWNDYNGFWGKLLAFLKPLNFLPDNARCHRLLSKHKSDTELRLH